ncbi:CAN5-like protein [Mya arenaria]|uniref:CAN5-like protein n=1 Tax=Mya arenaria TaxID=6604 RepID=A0ABY7DCX4_MYAAR|nr:CAN5-like protein [Mya arenaria]
MGCGQSSASVQDTRANNTRDYTKHNQGNQGGSGDQGQHGGNNDRHVQSNDQNKSGDSGFNENSKPDDKKTTGGIGHTLSNADDDGNADNNVYQSGGFMVSFGGGGQPRRDQNKTEEPIPEQREPSPPPPKEPTPPPPKDPTPPPPKDPTPPPPKDPTPPPPKNPTPPPPRDPTPPPPPTEQTEQNMQCKVQDNYTQEHIHSEVYIYTCSPYDFRQNPEEMDRIFSEPPTESPFVDHDFGPEVAIQGESVEWKRPGEVRDNPVLFSDGVTRYDIGQGSAGTCWFLSMVALLADKPEVFHRVVPKDAWNQDGGYFHCFFYRFGEWEDVYIDDFLPIIHGTEFWGAKSSEDRNEIWPALLEKAFARFHGSYNNVYGGQSGDAFLALTGGCSEYIDFDEALEADAGSSKMAKAREVHERLQNASRLGEGMLATEVPAKYDKKHGLVGGHAYSLVDAQTVEDTNGNTHRLVRIRNPWGNTEWNGPWSDKGKEWSMLSEGTLDYRDKDDGEFWMSLKDFITYFSGVTVCSFIPDFDKDGQSDSLNGDNYCTPMYGAWCGENAAGFENRIGNPRYQFHISDEGMGSDGLVPLVVQICQRMEHRKTDKESIRVDLYKCMGETSHGGCCQAVMALLGDVNNVYKQERHYCAVPSTINAGTEKEFMIRVFSPSPLRDVRELGRDYMMMECDNLEEKTEHDKIKFTETLFGAWKAGFNAGGQMDPSEDMSPKDIDYLDNKYESCCRSDEGEDGAFVMGNVV